MTVQTTSTLSNSIRSVYKSKYALGQKPQKVYDQAAMDYTSVYPDGKSMDELMQSDYIYLPFLGVMAPSTSAISQVGDVSPQTLRDAKTGITWTSRGDALQWSKQTDIQLYSDYAAAAFQRVGEAAGVSIDLLAQEAALQGTLVRRYVARASLDAGTAAHRASDSIFPQAEVMLMDLGAPGLVGDDGSLDTLMAILHPFPFHDIRESGNIDTIGVYQDKGIHLNYEIGQIGKTRLVVTKNAKVFGAAGADNGTNVASTLGAAANQLATSITTATDVSANITSGLYVWIGTEETGSTFYATNERVKVISASGTTVTILGAAPNGGLLYDHAAGVAVRNADSVYPLLFCGPESLVRVYASECGPFGEIVGPRKTGLLDQWTYAGYWYFGQYNRISEHRLLRWEVSTSYEA